ncbi:MAG: type IV pili methyl-accepting chemotaxis transducer N-terminal domain-containing protein [Arcobacteraceae bacterium]|nr:type IV pili methyl-accepting chemotaxis transducer N-terminal domain-containing protein [Campylobacterales bacterium]
MKPNTISTKIKLIGIFFIILMTSIIITTIYLNEKNKKDAQVINIAGKQRMLTQKISKNIFYIYHNNNQSYNELDNATIEFMHNLNSLKNGNDQLGIYKAPTDGIEKQISKVEILWNNFYLSINEFKKILDSKDTITEQKFKNSIDSIYTINTILLNEVDILVSMYTAHMEEKSDYLKTIQYIFGLIILFLMMYSFNQLKTMEENVKKFFELSKKIVQNPINEPLELIQIEAEKEIVEATDTINCFIDKINSAMIYSANAVEQSKNASIKLEEITDEFDVIINELTNSAEISVQLNKSEDIVIQTQEELISSTKKLQELKNELDKLLNSCKIK